MKPIIEIRNISKKYPLKERQSYYSLRDTLVEILKNPLKAFNRKASDFWALKNVSMDIEQGDIVGIIGSNGAGKSTLLKILSQITPPSSGEVILRGKIASLLEIGTGFHPELTGRENVFLNGTILGMTRKEINQKFDEIVNFSGVKKFIDTPVKHYSSGMYTRLAFSVAVHLEPDILIVDEVLSVGDLTFQKKSLEKMRTVSKQGRTVLFVSHNLAAISALCNKAALLKDGQLLKYGPTEKVINEYLKISQSLAPRMKVSSVGNINKIIKVKSIKVLDKNRVAQRTFDIHSPILLQVDYDLFRDNTFVNLNIQLFNSAGVLIFNSPANSRTNWKTTPLKKGSYRSTCEVASDFFVEGLFAIRVTVLCDYKNQTTELDFPNSATFTTQEAKKKKGFVISSYNSGVIIPRTKWLTKQIKK